MFFFTKIKDQSSTSDCGGMHSAKEAIKPTVKWKLVSISICYKAMRKYQYLTPWSIQVDINEPTQYDRNAKHGLWFTNFSKYIHEGEHLTRTMCLLHSWNACMHVCLYLRRIFILYNSIYLYDRQLVLHISGWVTTCLLEQVAFDFRFFWSLSCFILSFKFVGVT